MDMEQWARVRREVLVNGRSKRSVMAEEGLHWETLQKMLCHSQPPGYRRVKKRGRKIDALATVAPRLASVVGQEAMRNEMVH